MQDTIVERRIQLLEDVVHILRKNGFQMKASAVESFIADLRAERDDA